MKKLMILGAGIYQVPLIRKAKEMGLTAVVASVRGPYPGFAFADKTHFIDTRDAAAICGAAEAEGVSGVVTTGTDVAVRSLGYVCDKMGFQGISFAAARTVTDKALMKRAFEGKVRTGRFRLVRSKEEACRAAAELGFPVMIKACDLSGSRGVTRAGTEAEVLKAAAEAERVSRIGYYIVEEFVRGTEIGIDAFVYDGELVFCEPHTKYNYHAGGVTIPGGHGFPCKLTEKQKRSVRREIEAVVRSTGMNFCAVNVDAILTEDGGLSVIEAGGRCGATCIPELIWLHTGIDYYEQIILNALGERPSFAVKWRKPCIAELLFTEREGVIRSIDFDKIEALRAECVQLKLDYGVGDRISAVRNGTDRIGHVVMETGNEAAAERVCRLVKEAIVIE